jgi:hypothetical protein
MALISAGYGLQTVTSKQLQYCCKQYIAQETFKLVQMSNREGKLIILSASIKTTLTHKYLLEQRNTFWDDSLQNHRKYADYLNLRNRRYAVKHLKD